MHLLMHLKEDKVIDKPFTLQEQKYVKALFQSTHKTR